jgi:prepilin-type N-terminal cleavage/methylation domain-containing protein
MSRDNLKSEITNCKSPAGFTLIELLTVIVIIGILVGLVVGAYFPVRNAVRNAAMKQEISQISLALESCRTQFGMNDYPADFTDTAGTVNDLTRCLQRAFPRCQDNLPQLIQQLGITTPDQAIVFWLGGVWDPTQKRFIGFSANPLHPLDSNANRIGPFYDFDKARLEFTDDTQTKPTYRFFPKNDRINSMANNRPLLYFKAQGGLYQRAAQGSQSAWTAAWSDPLGGNVLPFMDAKGAWINGTSYQLMCPGLDGMYCDQTSKKQTTNSNAPIYPVGTNYGPAVYDDITNFVQGAKIESDVP